jgi:protein gp37
MARGTAISWTHYELPDGTISRGNTWNFLRGCSVVSEECRFCYAMYLASTAKMSDPGKPYAGLARRRATGLAQWTGEVQFVRERLADPLRWTKPSYTFVNSMSDWAHANVPFAVVAAAFGVVAAAQDHQFQFLTKRAERMLEFFGWLDREAGVAGQSPIDYCLQAALPHLDDWMPTKTGDQRLSVLRKRAEGNTWPLFNAWMGTSVGLQDYAHRAILLKRTPAAVRFVSAEPLLGPVDFTRCVMPDGTVENALDGAGAIDQIITGAESGDPDKARPMDVQWVRDIKDAVKAHGRCFYHKQDAVNGRKIETPEVDGQRWKEMPGYRPGERPVAAGATQGDIFG